MGDNKCSLIGRQGQINLLTNKPIGLFINNLTTSAPAQHALNYVSQPSDRRLDLP